MARVNLKPAGRFGYSLLALENLQGNSGPECRLCFLRLYVAAKRGMGPSTFARLIITSAVEDKGGPNAYVTRGELEDVLEKRLPELVRDAMKTGG